MISDRQVEIIASRLAERMSGSPSPARRAAPVPAPEPRPAPEPMPKPAPAPGISTEGLGDGVFATIDDAVAAARAAYREFDGVSLKARKRIIASIRKSMLEHAEELARLAHEETGLGRVEDKIIKNRLVTEKTQGTEVLTPGAVTGDDGLTLTRLPRRRIQRARSYAIRSRWCRRATLSCSMSTPTHVRAR